MLKEINAYDSNKLVHKIFLLNFFPHLMISLKICDSDKLVYAV